MKYSVRNEGGIYIAEPLLYTAAKGCVPIGFAPARAESIPVTIERGWKATEGFSRRATSGSPRRIPEV